MKHVKPTNKQVEAEIAWLARNKHSVPRRTAFGDDNWKAIDVQLLVLRERLSVDDCSDRGDEKGWTQRDYEGACKVARWLAGEDRYRLSLLAFWDGPVQ
jgi:hypothetical protein